MPKFLQVVLAVSVLLTVAAVACGGDEAEPTTVPPAPTSAAADPTATTPAPSPTPSEPRELIVMTHDSFDLSAEVIREFEQVIMINFLHNI